MDSQPSLQGLNVSPLMTTMVGGPVLPIIAVSGPLKLVLAKREGFELVAGAGFEPATWWL